MEGFKVKFQKLCRGSEWECNRQEYAFVCVCVSEREKEGFGKRRNHRKRREKAVALLVLHATNTQMKIQSPTQLTIFFRFLVHKFLIILASP
jgi:hypothetical protein